MGKTVRGPMGPPGSRGPPGEPCDSSNDWSALKNDDGRPLNCPVSVSSRRQIERNHYEIGSLVFVREENIMVLKTSENWLELQVTLCKLLCRVVNKTGMKS